MVQIINIGAVPNDGTGDFVRDAFDKVNQNSQDFDNRINQINSALEEFEGGEPGDVINGIEIWDPEKQYIGGAEYIVYHETKVYEFKSQENQTGVTPGTNASVWQEIPWSLLAHQRNRDFKVEGYPADVDMASSGEFNPHQSQYAGKNTFIFYSSNSGTKNITIAALQTDMFFTHPMRHKFIIFIDPLDEGTYIFAPGNGFKTPSGGSVTLTAGGWMVCDYVQAYYETEEIVAMLGFHILSSTSYQTPIEGLTPEFRVEGSLFQYKITGEESWTTIYDFDNLIPEGIDDAIAHANTAHQVTAGGGFQAGTNASAVDSPGVAIGNNAEVAEGINAIQLGNGLNDVPNTVKVFGYPLVQSNGQIYPQRLPSSTIRPVVLTSDQVILASTANQAYVVRCLNDHVDIVLPSAETNANMPITFRLGAQDSGYAMTIERSGTDDIYVNGDTWAGITSDVLGFWVTLISDGTRWYVVSDSGIAPENNATS